MPSYVDFSGRPFHFIGIGGIGMSALAYILALRKLPVYGSDIKPSHITDRLQALGAHIFWHQEASNFDIYHAPHSKCPDQTSAISTDGDQQNKETEITPKNLPQVVCSTAIQTANSEYQKAVSLGCPILHRSDLLAALITQYQSIAIAGTHGKTTTSSAIGHLLLKADLDPTIIVGGEVNTWGGNARLGNGKYLVAEADESDGSLIKFAPKIGIITNIELDHPDHYQSLEEVINTFKTFTDNCQIVIGCLDSIHVKENIKPNITYSLDPDSGADYTVDGVNYQADQTTAQVWEKGNLLGELNLKLLGAHNLSNSLAVIAVGRLLNLSFPVIAQSISSFEGAKRRFEKRGEANHILFVDDYAHHPSEIQVTLAAARLRMLDRHTKFPSGRVIAIFQPHRYSRTVTFLSEFAQCFSDADMVVLTDIYSAGESDLGQINGKQVAEKIGQYHQQIYYQPSLSEVTKFLKEILQPGDLALFLGAGNLNQIIPELIDFYQHQDE